MDLQLFEFDKRFSAFGDQFTFYDYNNPTDFPAELESKFGIVVADPPYLVTQKTSSTFMCPIYVH